MLRHGHNGNLGSRLQFYGDFGTMVQQAGSRSTSEWLQAADVLITGTSYPPRLELDLIEAASEIGMPSISFVEHWTNLAARFERKGQRIMPDVVCVVDRRAHDLAAAEGISEERLLISGNPYHRYLQSWQPSLTRKDVLRLLGLDSYRAYLLYVSEPLSRFGLRSKYGFDEVDGLSLLLRAMEMLDQHEICLVVKGHPNQDHELLEAILAKSTFSHTTAPRNGYKSAVILCSCCCRSFL